MHQGSHSQLISAVIFCRPTITRGTHKGKMSKASEKIPA